MGHEYDYSVSQAYYGYTKTVMDVSVAEAKNRPPELILPTEGGELVVITRNGKPVAQLAPRSPERRRVRFDNMQDRIQLLPGRNDPIDLDLFLEGHL